ncbi:hypothetical protein [Vogesella oryzae]|uniref:hypothetical protein n=1 Tax=Vogesella oryzae TaxID=1735285 RepID=UPI001582B2B0|nr:hypothetical protein [Vogesella oryzae]
MIAARRLIAQPGSFGQCQATRAYSYYNDTPTTDKRCQLSARFELAGAHYCSKHAGVVALRVLLGETEKDSKQ